MTGPLIVIPCLNEAAHICGLLGQLKPYARQSSALIVVADGGSTDGTREIVADAASGDPTIELLHNPARIQSAAVNLAVARYGEGRDYLIRIDAHAGYPDDYCEVLVAEAESTEAISIVVGMIAEGNGVLQSAIAAAQNSRLGNGGSKHRSRPVGEYVDHGHHALIRIPAFREVGGYDETFRHNEDAEFDVRLGEAGYRIWLTPKTVVTYYPRETFTALGRQYWNYGVGRARTVMKHRLVPKPRQAVVLLVAPALALAALTPVSAVFGLPAIIWATACFAGGLAIAAEKRSVRFAWAGPAAALMHAAWSAGFWREVLRRRLTRREALAG